MGFYQLPSFRAWFGLVAGVRGSPFVVGGLDFGFLMNPLESPGIQFPKPPLLEWEDALDGEYHLRLPMRSWVVWGSWVFCWLGNWGVSHRPSARIRFNSNHFPSKPPIGVGGKAWVKGQIWVKGFLLVWWKRKTTNLRVRFLEKRSPPICSYSLWFAL